MSLSEAAKKERARYMREWRRRNKEKIKQMNEQYWEKKAQKQWQENQ